MYEFVESLLPKEVKELTDVNMLRDLREYFDSRVQEEKTKKENASIDKYRDTYEGKILLIYGVKWDGPISAQNVNDINIVKVNKLLFVGNGFVRADVDVLNIKYDTPRHELKIGLTADNYGEITINTYHDNQYSIHINDFSYASSLRKKSILEPVFLTVEEVDKYITEAVSFQQLQVDDFKKKLGIK